jgi:microsomal epoxide hydrolase
MPSLFSKIPSSATLKLEPFTVDIDDESLNELKALLKSAKLPIVTFENTREDRRFGITRKWIQVAKAKWENQFDW